MCKISASEFGTMGMRTLVYTSLAMVTVGVVHSIYEAVTRLSFGVIW